MEDRKNALKAHGCQVQLKMSADNSYGKQILEAQKVITKFNSTVLSSFSAYRQKMCGWSEYRPSTISVNIEGEWRRPTSKKAIFLIRLFYRGSAWMTL